MWTGFTSALLPPALSDSIAKVCEEGLKAASSKKITISVDLNYRAKLWKYGKTPLEVIPDLVQYCDLVMGNIWAANTMLGIPLDDALISEDEQAAYLEQAAITSEAIQAHFPKCKTVANTYRFSDDAESKIKYYAALYTDGVLYHSATYNSSEVIDKSGSGDCFMAGLIYATREGYDAQHTIDFATSCRIFKIICTRRCN